MDTILMSAGIGLLIGAFVLLLIHWQKERAAKAAAARKKAEEATQAYWNEFYAQRRASAAARAAGTLYGFKSATPAARPAAAVNQNDLAVRRERLHREGQISQADELATSMFLQQQIAAASSYTAPDRPDHSCAPAHSPSSSSHSHDSGSSHSHSSSSSWSDSSSSCSDGGGGGGSSD